MTGPRQLTFETLGGETVTVQPRGKHYVEPRGYAWRPGTGPAGEKCGSCAHAHRFGRYAKCEKARAKWSHGRGTDILLHAAACKEWQRDEEASK